MKAPRFLLLVLAALCAVMTPRPAEARTEVSFDFFYDSLSPYGEWLQVADYGYCWRPTDMDPDWTPYSDGYWAYTDAGWTWVSYEDFGGIVYHYGRWVRVEDEGWCWTPDYEWGPAWVSWRNSDDYVGWAPLPPEARWQPSVGISVWADRDYDIGPAYYNFCRVRDFGAPVLRPVIINRVENVTIIRRTVNITNITYNTHYNNGPIIYNGGPSFTVINQRSARPVPALKLVQNVNIDVDGMRGARRGDRRINFNGRAEGNQLLVTAPYVKPPQDPSFLKPQVKKVIAADKVTRGWNGVKNDEVRKELRQEMNRQTKGLTRDTTPAKAVAVNDLKVLPEKADPKAPSPLATREPGQRPGRDGRDDKNDDGRPGKDKNGKMPNVAGQPSGPGDGTDGRTKPGVTTETDDKTPGKGRGPLGRDGQKPSGPGLKPFNPVAETDQKPGNDQDNDRGGKGKGRISGAPGTDATTPDPRVAKPGNDGAKMRDAEPQPQKPQPGETLRKLREAQAQKAAEAADQEKVRTQGEAATKMQQRDALRQQQQKDNDAAAARAKMQADQQERAARAADQQEKARKQGEAAAKMQQQRDAFRQQQQQQQQQQNDAAAARQKMQADQQERAARAAAMQQRQAEMQRRQLDQQKQPQEAIRGRDVQRPQTQSTPPGSRPSSDSDDENDKKKKKKN